jgi:hypothetical protein
MLYGFPACFRLERQAQAGERRSSSVLCLPAWSFGTPLRGLGGLLAEAHSALVDRAVRWLRNTQRCSIALAECGAGFGEIPDAIGWLPRGQSVVVECKTTVGDFYADRGKPSRRVDSLAIGQYRWFFTPGGLLKLDLIPEPWGLVELKSDRCYVRKKPTPVATNHTLETAILVAELNRVTGGWRKLVSKQGIAADARCEREHPRDLDVADTLEVAS